MANSKLVIVGVVTLVILLQLSTCALARHHGKPDPCAAEDDDSVPGMRHKTKKPHCPSPGGGGGSGRGGGDGTPGVMTVNGFEKGQEGGGAAACDGKFHSDGDMIVALSTQWYAGGRRCHKMISITSKHNGRTVKAKVVDECDSNHGCKNNIVDTSEAVWKALGLDSNIGEVPVTWSDA